MEGLNRVMLLGNLGADPELRMTGSGQAVLNVRLATSEKFLDKNKQKQERTEWHRVTIWGKRAEALGKLLRKGDRILVEGSLRTTNWEKDGVKHYRTDIVGTEVLLQGGRNDNARAARPLDGEDEPAGDAPMAGADWDDIPF